MFVFPAKDLREFFLVSNGVWVLSQTYPEFKS